MTDPKNSVREKEPHLTPVVCLEQSAGIPGDGKDRMGAALGESKSMLDMRSFCVLRDTQGQSSSELLETGVWSSREGIAWS